MAAALVLLLLRTAAADPAPPPWQGVWQGTIGTLPVRACLAQRGAAYSVGSYYYLSRLRPIPLDHRPDGSWREDGPTGKTAPRLTFLAPTADTLGGTWQDGARRLPIRLARVAAGEDPCGDPAFHAPRLRRLRVTTTRATIDGTGYAKYRFDPGPAFPDVVLESFALIPRDAATGRINARLRREMPDDAAKGAWFECVTSGVVANGRDGDYQSTVRPTLLTPRWLAAEAAAGGYCGGAHPWSAVTPLLFDRTTGAEVDLSTWLNEKAIDRSDDSAKLTPALRRLVLARAGPGDPECTVTLATADYWDIGLTRTGLAFTPQLPHVVTACAETTSLPWAVVAPWLSAKGEAGRRTLR